MPPDPGDMLLGRFRDGALASFYIVRHPSGAALRDWAGGLLARILRESGRRAPPEAHPDIVLLRKDDGEPWSASCGVTEAFLGFGRHLPMDLPWKFLVLESPGLLPEGLSNKLLKSLEEPPPRSTVLFLHDGEGRLPGTVESRAVSLRLPGDVPPPSGADLPEGLAEPLERFLDGGAGLGDLLDRALEADPRALVPLLLERFLSGGPDGRRCRSLLDALEDLGEFRAHRNNPRAGLLLLLHACRGPGPGPPPATPPLLP